MNNKENSENSWCRNLTNIEEGIFRTINGNSDELIAIGRTIKAGFPCSRVDVTNARYDAIIDVDGINLLRVQIKGTSHGSLSLTGGGRSGKQIDKNVESRSYSYTKKDCDVIIGLDGNNGDCYIIPVEDLEKWGSTKALSQLQEYRENWHILQKIVDASTKNK